MKTENKIIITSIALGPVVWIADALVDYAIFYEGTFTGILITDVPSHELYMRLLIMVVFVMFGLASSRCLAERRKAEQEKEKLIIELQEALDEVKTLSGFIPICASCKKIRDDKGYWSQIETYIEKHSSAQFSHAMCLECADELYGGQDWYEKAKKNGKITVPEFIPESPDT